MAFTAEELANINNSVLDEYLNKGTVFKQQIQAKPMLDAFDSAAGTFSGGKGEVSWAVASGKSGGTLQGFTHDDEVTYYNPANTKRAAVPWKEMHLGMGLTHTELKIAGINVVESGADQRNSDIDGRDMYVLAEMYEEKVASFGEDYAVDLDAMIHADGTADTKELAGIRSFLLDSPAQGSYGGISRVTNSWWRNRAATAAFNSDGGQNKITASASNGGALITFLEKEVRQLRRYARGAWRPKWFAGSDFIDAYLMEIRANGNYSDRGFMASGTVDGGMDDPSFKRMPFIYDPTLDDLGRGKFCYCIDMAKIKLLYLKGNKMKKANPARPPERYVQYMAVTTTAVMVAKQLNTSGVYEIN